MVFPETTILIDPLSEPKQTFMVSTTFINGFTVTVTVKNRLGTAAQLAIPCRLPLLD
jgi:hypothetical protein